MVLIVTQSGGMTNRAAKFLPQTRRSMSLTGRRLGLAWLRGSHRYSASMSRWLSQCRHRNVATATSSQAGCEVAAIF